MISIIICTHKAPPSISELFHSLAQQTLKSGYEIILVNNGFSDVRAAEITAYVRQLGLNDQLRIVREAIPGLSYARRKGFLEAKGEWFLLLDDDNSIRPDFLESFGKIVRSDNSLGGITPVITPVWEKEPPLWMQLIGLTCLSYNQLPSYQPTNQSKRYEPNEFDRAPHAPGGGMMIHRDCVVRYLNDGGSTRLGLGRKGNSLMSGEDFDLWCQIPVVHRSILATDSLQAYHHIPVDRLERRYLLRLNFQLARSYVMLSRMTGRQPQPFFSRFNLVRIKCAMQHLVRHPKPYPQAPFFVRILLFARQAGEIVGDYCSLRMQ
jgi:glycosyltransferase involved in cell wall biosynthesis